jgi:hypothetical protein
MRAVAGAILVLSATILVASVRIASRMNPQQADEGIINVILIGGAFALGVFGLMVLLFGLTGDRPPPTNQRPAT